MALKRWVAWPGPGVEGQLSGRVVGVGVTDRDDHAGRSRPRRSGRAHLRAPARSSRSVPLPCDRWATRSSSSAIEGGRRARDELRSRSRPGDPWPLEVGAEDEAPGAVPDERLVPASRPREHGSRRRLPPPPPCSASGLSETVVATRAVVPCLA